MYPESKDRKTSIIEILRSFDSGYICWGGPKKIRPLFQNLLGVPEKQIKVQVGYEFVF